MPSHKFLAIELKEEGEVDGLMQELTTPRQSLGAKLAIVNKDKCAIQKPQVVEYEGKTYLLIRAPS